MGLSPIGGVRVFLSILCLFFTCISHPLQTEIELEGGAGMMVNAGRLPILDNMVASTYHLCSCVGGKLFLVHTNSQGCFAAVDRRLDGICS